MKPGGSFCLYLTKFFRIKQTTSSSPGATQPMVSLYFTALYCALASSRTRLPDHTQRRVTVGWTPLNE
jgi:hypothetical protein